MMEYGYINENGYLVSKMLEEFSFKKQNEDGDIVDVVVSVEEQVKELIELGWKPVDLIDEKKLQAENGYTIALCPYDAGEHIAYKYNPVFDIKGLNYKIEALKKELADDDYKITKCYEASLIGKELPYDVNSLHTNREAIRKEINELEKLLE